MVLVKTEKGLQVMKDRSVALTPRQRSAFILFDGRRSAQEVLASTAAMGVVAADIELLVAQGLLREGGDVAGSPPAGSAGIPVAPPQGSAAVSVTSPPQAGDSAPEAGSGRSPQQRYMDAYPIATALTAGLGLRGFRLNLAVEAAGNYEELLQVAPRIREAVGAEKFAPLDRALNA